MKHDNWKLLWAIGLLIFAVLLFAQMSKCSELPAAPTNHLIKVNKPFLTATSVSLLALMGSAVAADCFTTQRGFGAGLGESNPIASAFGKSRKAGVALGLIGFSSGATAMWIAHRHHNRFWSVAIPMAVASIEYGVAAHNWRVGSAARADALRNKGGMR